MPVIGATVTAVTDQERFAAVIGPEGTFSFPAVKGWTFLEVTAKKTGYSFTPYNSTTRSNTTVQFLGSLTEYRLRGMVIDVDQRPVAGALINAGSLGSYFTDASGQFTIPVRYGTVYSLNAAASGYRFERNGLSGTIRGDVDRVFVAQVE